MFLLTEGDNSVSTAIGTIPFLLLSFRHPHLSHCPLLRLSAVPMAFASGKVTSPATTRCASNVASPTAAAICATILRLGLDMRWPSNLFHTLSLRYLYHLHHIPSPLLIWKCTPLNFLSPTIRQSSSFSRELIWWMKKTSIGNANSSLLHGRKLTISA